MISSRTSDPSIIDADVGIVGAGPGGMAAATKLAAAGLRVVVLDEGHRAGGQIYRQLPPGLHNHGVIPESPSHDHGHALTELFEVGAKPGSNIELVSNATVWDALPGRLWFEHNGASRMLRCGHIVLAPGAYDRSIPFPGWTLPGVVTAGALQVMVARRREVAPAERERGAAIGMRKERRHAVDDGRPIREVEGHLRRRVDGV